MPKKRTQKERLIAAVEAHGGEIIPSRSSKYVTMTTGNLLKNMNTTGLFFIGKSGGFRFGRSASNSVAWEVTAEHLLKEVPE